MYGNILNIDNNGEFVDKRLFKHYSGKYNDWLNNGIKVAKDKIGEKEDVTLVSLDLKDFYHSMLINYHDLPNGKNEKLGRILNDILGKAASHHMDELGMGREDENSFLPVGPYSSPILANWLLRELDNCLRGDDNCIYYGRYVDDILMVFHNETAFMKNVASMEDFLGRFTYNPIFSNFAEQDGRHIKIHLSSSYNDLEFNRDKFRIAVIQNSDPVAISSFTSSIIETSSFSYDYEDEENEDVINNDRVNFDRGTGVKANTKPHVRLLKKEPSFYKSETEQFRELLKKDNPRFEIAVQLDKVIEEQLTGPYDIDKELSSLLIGFFQGNFALSFYNLWERVFTYFFAIEDLDSIYELANKIVKAILLIGDITKGVVGLDDDEVRKLIRTTLFNHLVFSLAMAGSLKPSFIADLANKDFLDVGNIKSKALAIRKSFMLRREYMPIPFLFYVINQLPQEFNLMSKDLWNEMINNRNNFLITADESKYIPLTPSLFDISMSEFVYLLHKKKHGKEDVFHSYKRSDTTSPYTYLIDVVDIYNSIHRHQLKVGIETNSVRHGRSIYEQIDRITFLNNKNIHPVKKIGLANIKVDLVRINDCINDNGICKTTTTIYSRHRNLLDLADRDSVEVMVLPEVFVPIQFIYAYGKESQRKGRAFIFGLEHFHVSNVCFNMSCILLPFYINNKHEVLPIFRIKNYYSPSETEDVINTKCSIPDIKRAYYHWIDWYGLQFSLFNCYELTNISDRSLFKQKVDALFAIEYNKDTRYYSNIAEATARDNDCFFIQANSSDYGDTRIVSPQSDNLKDKVRIKGGENDVILTCTLDIDGLRNHLLGNIPSDKDIYKKTAAGYNKNEVKNRINHRNRIKILGIKVVNKKGKNEKK